MLLSTATIHKHDVTYTQNKKVTTMYSTSSIIRTSFIRHSIIRPLGQIIIYDITNTFPVNVGQ